MKKWLAKFWLFPKLGFLYKVSYRFNFVWDLTSIFSQTLLFFFIAKLVSPSNIPELAPYHNDYFAFVLIGIALSSYLSYALSTLPAAVKEEKALGTMEALVLAPESLLALILWASLYGLIEATLKIFAYLAVGFLLFGLVLPTFSIFSALVVLALSLFSFLPLGILGAGFILLYRQGNPISLSTGLCKFLGGVYFPITLFPDWLQKAVYLQPLTPALMALRKVTLGGATLSQISMELTWLTLFAVILLPISIGFFQWAFRKARMAGSLAHY